MPLRLPQLRLRLPAASRPRFAARRKAGRALGWGVAAFLGVQLSLGVASELYPRIRDPLYGDKFVKLERKLAATPKPTTVVMLGSSRTGLAFHGSRVEAAFADEPRRCVAFNYGTPASGPVTHLLYLNRMLKSGVVPDLLLVEVLPSMLAEVPGGPLERLWFYPDRITFREYDTLVRHQFPAGSVREGHLKSVAIPAFALRFQLLTRLAPSWVPWQFRFDWSRSSDESGWGTPLIQNPSPEHRAKAEQQARDEYAAVLADWKPGGGAVTALRELLETCRQRGIPVRLVLMPEGTTFRAMYSPTVLARLDEFLRTLGVPVIDARTWLPDDSFNDGHHMFRRGAEAFTDRLTRGAIRPALEGGRPK